jgi:peptide/nickel transport system substrate-binding protein
MRSRRDFQRPVAVALTSLLLAVGALGTATPTLAAQTPVLRIAQVAAPDSLNVFATFAAFYPMTWIYDMLAGVDAQRHRDRLGFAKSWSVSSDGLTWTFDIWPGLKWSDGQPATADDVVFTYNYIRNSAGDPNELNTGWDNTAGFDVISSISAVNSTTVTIVTKHPTTWPVDNTNFIVPKHIWQSISYADARGPFKNPPPTVGTGPMVATAWQASQNYFQFKPNPNFRNGPPAWSEAVFQYYSSSDPMVQNLESGNLDYAFGVTPTQWSALKGRNNIAVDKIRIEQQDYMAFNTAAGQGHGSSPALQDPAFRDAVGYAIDINSIASRGYQGLAIPGVGPIVPVSRYFTDLKSIQRTFNLDTARQKLDAAGYSLDSSNVRRDKQGKEIRLSMITGTPSGMDAIPIAVVELVVGWLGQIGIPVAVTNLDSGAIYSKTSDPSTGGGGWDLAIAGRWYSPDPFTLLSIASGPAAGDNNVSYWSNPQYDSLVQQISETVDPASTQTLVNQAATLVYQQSPYIFLDYPYFLGAYRTDHFTGWMSPEAASMWSYAPWDRVKPAGATTTSTSSTSTVVIVGAVIAVVVLIVAGVVLVRRRRRPSEE